nr:hypothetical protein [Campylobacter sp.]
MKKLILIVALCFTSAFACLCSPQILQAFQQLETKVKQSLMAQKSQLNSLKSKVENSIDLLDEQNLNLKKANEIEANLEIRKEKLIFLMQQKMELEK